MGDHEMADRDPVALLLDDDPWMSPWRSVLLVAPSPWRSVLLDGDLDHGPITLEECPT